MKPALMLMLLSCAASLVACSLDGGTGTGPTPSGAYVPAPNAGPAYAAGGADSSAKSSLANGDIAGAAAGFGQAVDTNPFDPIALNNLAVAKTEAGDFHTALELLERAERLAPQNTEVAANLARLRSWNQNYAMQDGSTLGQAGVPTGTTFKNLPPEPPPLWDTRTSAEK
ncbi:MAG: Tetratricopeptide repeat-containing protein [Hydrocarboniphaga sp.]|uniref:tetratricopeptide repeat protein n=1 Tax=Hydrocarboniphaga sp. TaxID=2033016 RepID=UPI002608E899|nr:tetratricopeptide repeat protein [Hydrocarboniphaga sp.]MDB5970708.1 Tetratricopeptide repeat-containing protein [Hydrocarboniphaga sp.]